MIIGACPYCEASQMNPYAGKPCFQKITCIDCGKIYWLRHSDFDPEAMDGEEFARRYRLEGRTVIDLAAEKDREERAKHPELYKLIDERMERVSKELQKKFEDMVLYGDTTEGLGTFLNDKTGEDK